MLMIGHDRDDHVYSEDEIHINKIYEKITLKWLQWRLRSLKILLMLICFHMRERKSASNPYERRINYLRDTLIPAQKLPLCKN